MPQSSPLLAKCPCGACEVELGRMPSVRFLCHCTICQSVYPGDFADATVTKADHVHVRTPDAMTFRKLKPPPALDRGTCNACNHPVVGLLDGPLGRLAFLPTAVLPQSEILPKPLRHVFYDTRVRDADDDLPKSEGALMSQLMLTWPILRVAMGR